MLHADWLKLVKELVTSNQSASFQSRVVTQFLGRSANVQLWSTLKMPISFDDETSFRIRRLVKAWG